MEYKERKKKLFDQLKSYLKEKEDFFKAEIFLESIQDWSEKETLSEIESWFEKCAATKSLDIEDIPLGSCRGWSKNEDGNYAHQSGEFFYLQGVRIKSSESREITDGWDQPIITQVGFNGGILGIIRKRFNEIPYYLLEAKAEPGNPDGVQISPTIQATFSNLKQAHKGRKPNFYEFFKKFENEPKTHIRDENILFLQWMSEDGGRLHLKRNLGILIEIEEEVNIPSNSEFKWMTMYQIKQLIKKNSWVNPHVRGIISSL